MSLDLFVGRIAASRMRVGPLAAYIDGFAMDRKEKGYRKAAAYNHLRAVAAMSRWLKRRGLGAGDLTPGRIAEFSRHWPPRGGWAYGKTRAMSDLVDHLRQAGVLPAADPSPEDPIGRVVLELTEYLTHERGLSPKTLVNYVPVVRCFLTERFSSGEIQLDTIGPGDITGFQVRHCPSRGRGYVRHVVGALRHFCRFLHLRGHVDTDLTACVLRPAQWRLASVPEVLTPKQVRRIIDSCDRSTPLGLRNYAILLLLARLGLRAGEIAELRLEDIHWDAGEIVVKGKGHRRDRLPLPHDVGAALADYLRRGRPRCSARQVFLRTYAPCRGFVSGSSLSVSVVKTAIERVGLNPPHKGAHLLRHSLATDMLARGATLTEIGQVLRHQLTKTTQIYAKVDLGALRSLAPKWPGGVR
jgi:site-specific recombinase XerD